MQISVAPYSTASRDARHELGLVVLVGVRRALALAEPAERAADGADVREVDVAVDDERHRLPRELARAARRPRRASPRSPRGASRRTAPSAPARSARSPSRARSHAPAPTRSASIANGAAVPAGAAPRDEAPVLRLDDVEHALLDPLAVHVLRVDAQPLGQRDAVGAAASCAPDAATGTGARARCGRRWPTARRGRSRPPATSSRPPVGEVRRDLDADVGHQPPRLADQALHVVDRDLAGPVGQRQRRLRPQMPVRQNVLGAPRSAISAGSSP